MAQVRPVKKKKPSVKDVAAPPEVSKPRVQEPRAQRLMLAGVCAVIILLCAAIYGQTLSFKFTNYDDNLFVTENQYVQAGLSLKTIGWAFVTEKAFYYLPLTWISLMFDHELYGMHPGGYHVTNLLLHTASAVLLFLALRLLTGALWRSLAVAALFAVHPLNVESVAWVAERKGVLSTFFWMLALGAYGLYVRKGGTARYALIAAAFIGGAMSKPVVVTLPFALLLLDCWPLDRVNFTGPLDLMARKTARLTAEKIPLFLIAALSCLSTYVMQARGHNIVATESVSLATRCANVMVAYVTYLVQALWPSGLAAFYPFPDARPAWQVAGAAVTLAAISLFCLSQARRRPYLIVGWLWYLGTLAPVVGLVQIGSFSHADRYTYLPLVGVFIMAAWGLADLAAAWHVPKQAVAAVACTVTVALAICAGVQASHWHDSKALFSHAIAVGQESGTAYTNLAQVAIDQKKYAEAKDLLEKALAVDPNFVDALSNLGVILIKQEHPEEAKVFLTKALGLRPYHLDVLNNLGSVSMMQKRYDEAETYLTKALDLQPDAFGALNNLGNVFTAQKRYDKAKACLTKSLDIAPGNVDAIANLGKLAMAQEDYDEARARLTKALDLKPDHILALVNLGVLAIKQGRYDEAKTCLTKALDLEPDNIDALYNLAQISIAQGRNDEAKAGLTRLVGLSPSHVNALAQLGGISIFNGQYDEAKDYLKKALALDPQCVVALNNLAVCLINQGQYGESQSHLRKALEIDPNNVFAMKTLGTTLTKMGQKEEADHYFMKAAELEQAHGAKKE